MARTLKNNKEQHTVYALMLDYKPIYVGCTMDLNKREKQHRKIKTFDYVLVIKIYDNKQDALIAENAIIRFMSLFIKGSFLNSTFEDMMVNKLLTDWEYMKKKEREVDDV